MTPIKKTRGHFVREKCAARLAVEAVLLTATMKRPVTAPEVAAATGFAITVVRTHISNCVNYDVAHNIDPPRTRNPRYVWGPKPKPARATNLAGSRQVIGEGFYNGAELRPYTGRAGALDAYQLASIQNGVAVEARRPMIISSSAQTGPAAMRGRL